MNKLKFLTILLIISVFCFSACNNKSLQNDLNKNVGENLEAETGLKNEEEKKILYFYKDSFVGYLQNNIWKAPKDVLLKEIFDNEFYTVYPTSNEKMKSNKLQANLGNFGYGGFDYEGAVIQSIEDGTNIDVNLGKHAITSENGEYIFELPNKLNNTLNNSFTESLADVELTNVKLLADGYEYTEHDNNNLISFNSDFDLKFAEESKIENLSEDVIEYLKNSLEENGVNKEAPYQVVQYFKCDLNNDSSEDEVFNIVSSDAYMLKNEITEYENIDNVLKENGGFSIIITKINGKLNTIDEFYISLEEIKKSEFSMVGSTENYLINVVDLNEDGIYEILYSVNGWEYWWHYLVVYNDDAYIKVTDIPVDVVDNIKLDSEDLKSKNYMLDSYKISELSSKTEGTEEYEDYILQPSKELNFSYKDKNYNFDIGIATSKLNDYKEGYIKFSETNEVYYGHINNENDIGEYRITIYDFNKNDNDIQLVVNWSQDGMTPYQYEEDKVLYNISDNNFQYIGSLPKYDVVSSDGKLCKHIEWLEEEVIEKYYEIKDGEMITTNNTFDDNISYSVISGEKYKKIFRHSGWTIFNEKFEALDGTLEENEKVKIISVENDTLLKIQRENGDIVYFGNGAGVW